MGDAEHHQRLQYHSQGRTERLHHAGGENAKVNIEASTVTANNIHGNFSNGGIWTIKEESILDINTAGNHGLSVEELTVNNSTVSVDGAAYTGILAAKVTLEKDANVTVTNCGKDLPQKSQWLPIKCLTRTPWS